MVYFIKTGNFVLIKYLSSNRDLKLILSHIESFNPFPPEVIASIDADPKTERRFSKILKDCKIKYNWYLYGDEVDELIKNPDQKLNYTPNGKKISKKRKEAREAANEIKEKYEEGATPSELQLEYGLPKRMIDKIIPKKLKRKADDWAYSYKNKRNRKAVLCIDTGEVFDSVGEAAKTKEAPKVSEVCRGKRKTSNKLRFRFLDEEEKKIFNNIRSAYDKIFLADIERLQYDES